MKLTKLVYFSWLYSFCFNRINIWRDVIPKMKIEDIKLKNVVGGDAVRDLKEEIARLKKALNYVTDEKEREELNNTINKLQEDLNNILDSMR